MGLSIDKMIGYKFFKENEDNSIDSIRLMKYYKFGNNESLKVINTETGKDKIISVLELKSYKAYKPDGVLILSAIKLDNTKDILVTGYLLDRLEKGDMKPFCACRQGITDIFYNLMIQNESDMITGLAVNVLDVPQGFDFGTMLLADEVLFTNTYMIYKDDTLDKILELFKDNTDEYDKVLEELYLEHAKYNPSALFSDEDKGWCRTLSKLLKENNFQSDLDEMFGVTTVDFEIKDYLVEAKIAEDSTESYLTVTDELKYWLSYLYKLDINKVYAIEYDNDIDFDDLKKSRYLLFRDKVNKMYVFVYTIGKEYKEAELEELDKQLDFSTKFRISYLDKYKKLQQANTSE